MQLAHLVSREALPGQIASPPTPRPPKTLSLTCSPAFPTLENDRSMTRNVRLISNAIINIINTTLEDTFLSLTGLTWNYQTTFTICSCKAVLVTAHGLPLPILHPISGANFPSLRHRLGPLTGRRLTLFGVCEAEHVVLAEDDAAAGAEHHRLTDAAAVYVAERAIIREQHHDAFPARGGRGHR